MGAMEDKTVIFDDEASELYDSYKSYTQKKANIISIAFPKSILAIEMAGRSFKAARIAALWALAQNKRTIDKATLDAAFYFAEYTANHFQRFEKMISLKPYELLANDYIEGILHNTLPIDKAITSGYIISTSKSSIMSFLEPLNSYLKGTATVNYSDKENAFIFTPVKKNISTGDYCYSASPISIGQLRSSVSGYTHIKPVAELALINALTSLDSVYSPFATTDDTKFVVLDIDSSELSMEVLHEYMKPYYHIISTQEDVDDNHTYTVILPVNETISKKEYRYIVNSIAVNFMLRATPEQISSEAVYNTYKDAHILSSTENPMATFDVSEIKARYASKKSQPNLSTKLPLTTVQARKKLSEALEAEEMMVSHIDNSDNHLLAFAQVARSLHIDNIEPTTLLDIVDSINSLIEDPISESKKLKYLLDPFKEIS